MENGIFCGAVAKWIEKDNYEKGCFGGIQDFGIILDDFRAGSVRELIEKVADFFGISADALEYDEINNFFWFDREENDNGDEAGAAELEKFKAGKIDLWLARYSLSVRRSCEVGADEMRAALTA